jgi:hypothetical protein
MRRTVLAGVGVPLAAAAAGACAVASPTAGLSVAIAALVLLILAWISIGRNQRSWGYVERADDLLVTHGGLVNVKLHTAAATTDAKVCGLTPDTATRLRDRLTELGEAHASGL